jgi:hypothetical protein
MATSCLTALADASHRLDTLISLGCAAGLYGAFLNLESSNKKLSKRMIASPASAAIAGGYVTQPLASTAHMGNNDAEALIATG